MEPVGGSELDGVVDEAHDDAAGAVGVGLHGEGFADPWHDLQGDFVASGLCAEAVSGWCDNLVEV